ncbi:MAG: hypothetical protein ABR512_15600 [Desulfopila sp.]
MKKLFLLCFLVVLWASPAIVFSEYASPWEKKLPFESAIIHYALSGMEEGEETLYIRDYGKERATYHQSVSTMIGLTANSSTIELQTPYFIYSYDLLEKEGVKTSNPQKFMIEEYAGLSPAEKKKVRENAEKIGTVSAEAMAEGMGGEGLAVKIEHNAVEILGYSCDKVEVMGGVIYLLHDTDICLKSELNVLGMKMEMVATSVREGDVDDTFFQHPAGIRAEMDAEAERIVKEMAGQVVAIFKDPDYRPHSKGQTMGLSEKMKGLSEEEKLMIQQAEKMMQTMKGMLQEHPTEGTMTDGGRLQPSKAAYWDVKKIETGTENLLTPFLLRFILPAYVDSVKINNLKIVSKKFAEITFNPR